MVLLAEQDYIISIDGAGKRIIYRQSSGNAFLYYGENLLLLSRQNARFDYHSNWLRRFLDLYHKRGVPLPGIDGP
jgi:hypothetical protein